MPASTTKFANLVRVIHRDEVEAPLTDWMLEAYAYADPLAGFAQRNRHRREATLAPLVRVPASAAKNRTSHSTNCGAAAL